MRTLQVTRKNLYSEIEARGMMGPAAGKWKYNIICPIKCVPNFFCTDSCVQDQMLLASSWPHFLCVIFKVRFCSIISHDPIFHLSKCLFSKNTFVKVRAILIVWRILMVLKTLHVCIVQNYHHNNKQVFVTFIGSALLQ